MIDTKICSLCKKEKPLIKYRSRGGSQKHLLKSRCNDCLYKEHRRWVEENLEKVSGYREKDSWTIEKRCRRRGISPEELFECYKKQENKCAICKKEICITESAIDHNHKTDKFRGLLCKTCNRALGMFKDSPKILKSAVDYLKEKGFYGNV